MIVSRTMRPSDYNELKTELETVEKVIGIVGLDPAQHTHRRWEYAMALHAVRGHFGDTSKRLQIADFGCAIGLLTPIMIYLGHDLTMYEIWAYGNQEEQALRQAEVAVTHAQEDVSGTYRMVHRGLGTLIEDDKNQFDVSFCISTMEHIQNEIGATNDLLDSVTLGGLIFLTMDFAPDGVDHYMYKEMRARIYDRDRMSHLVDLGCAKGFELLGGQTDWAWVSECIMVHDYSFSSLAMVKN